MSCAMCGGQHGRTGICQRVAQAALALDLYVVPATLTDPLNRVVCVNRAYARLVGDPLHDGLSLDERFIPAMMVGLYRERFPRAAKEVASCLPGLLAEVDAGRLAGPTLRMADALVASSPQLLREADKEPNPWDGTVVVRDADWTMTLVREQVVAVANWHGEPSGFHVALWYPEHEAAPLSDGAALLERLTVRQRQIGRWFAIGLTAREVAGVSGISLRTARDHLEDIYSRLGIHSRAELARVYAKEGLI